MISILKGRSVCGSSFARSPGGWCKRHCFSWCLVRIYHIIDVATPSQRWIMIDLELCHGRQHNKPSYFDTVVSTQTALGLPAIGPGIILNLVAHHQPLSTSSFVLPVLKPATDCTVAYHPAAPVA